MPIKNENNMTLPKFPWIVKKSKSTSTETEFKETIIREQTIIKSKEKKRKIVEKRIKSKALIKGVFLFLFFL